MGSKSNLRYQQTNCELVMRSLWVTTVPASWPWWTSSQAPWPFWRSLFIPTSQWPSSNPPAASTAMATRVTKLVVLERTSGRWERRHVLPPAFLTLWATWRIDAWHCLVKMVKNLLIWDMPTDQPNPTTICCMCCVAFVQFCTCLFWPFSEHEKGRRSRRLYSWSSFQWPSWAHFSPSLEPLLVYAVYRQVNSTEKGDDTPKGLLKIRYVLSIQKFFDGLFLLSFVLCLGVYSITKLALLLASSRHTISNVININGEGWATCFFHEKMRHGQHISFLWFLSRGKPW